MRWSASVVGLIIGLVEPYPKRWRGEIRLFESLRHNRRDGSELRRTKGRMPFAVTGNARHSNRRTLNCGKQVRQVEEERASLKKGGVVVCQKRGVKYAFMHDHQSGFRVTTMSRVREVGASGFYV